MPAASLRKESFSSSRSQSDRVRSWERVSGSSTSPVDVSQAMGSGDEDDACLSGARAEGCRPAAPAVEESYRSRRCSMVRDIVSEMLVRSLRRRSTGMGAEGVEAWGLSSLVEKLSRL